MQRQKQDTSGFTSMTHTISNHVMLLLALGAALVDGCVTQRADLDLATYDPAQDQRTIATYYSHEAARLRQTAEELSVRIALYERLFGPASDWVAGARLLAQSYEEEAKDLERKAREHLEHVEARRPSP